MFIRLNVDETEKTASFSKPLNNQNSVDYSGDAKLISKIRSNHSRKYANTVVREIQTEELGEFQTERAYSAPEIVRTEVQQSCSTIVRTDSLIDSRDASTNT